MAKKDIEKQMSEELSQSLKEVKAEKEANKPLITKEENESFKEIFGHDMEEYVLQQSPKVEEPQPTAITEASQTKEDLQAKYPQYDYNKGKNNSSPVSSRYAKLLKNWKPNPDIIHNGVFGFLHKELDQQLLQEKAFVRKYLNGKPYDCIPMMEVPIFKGDKADRQTIPTHKFTLVRKMINEGKITLKTKRITL